MTRAEIKDKFRAENPELTTRVLPEDVLNTWCVEANLQACIITRCIVDNTPTSITPVENEEYWDLTAKITRFYDIDEWPGGGVYYNDKVLKKTSMSELNKSSRTWTSRASGTPTKYFRRGKYLWVDRPIDSNVYTIKVHSVLYPTNYTSDADTPFNNLSYLAGFSDAISKYLQWRGKVKLRKYDEAQVAKQEFLTYCMWMKKMIGGGTQSPIRFERRV